ncbi:hypothetical protein GOP47_0015857 [Adiantum capillus-veneris]|uniref:X8 domain-containing protein n=1 Tax=Adiantum capillus-veneris TaxID=13818 RepID=A0A9D4ULD2_ADICA|nr:hypothetical protein GOP47_0015857 [Adiantum capillus-veneris]
MGARFLASTPSPSTFVCAVFTLYVSCCILCFSPATSSAKTTNAPIDAQQTGDTGQKLWCVAKPSAPENLLMANLNFACGEGGVDCTQLQQGHACYSPNTIISHASYAMNMYYQKHGRNYWNCYFQNTGLVVFTDPSYGDCMYSPQ